MTPKASKKTSSFVLDTERAELLLEHIRLRDLPRDEHKVLVRLIYNAARGSDAVLRSLVVAYRREGRVFPVTTEQQIRSAWLRLAGTSYERTAKRDLKKFCKARISPALLCALFDNSEESAMLILEETLRMEAWRWLGRLDDVTGATRESDMIYCLYQTSARYRRQLPPSRYAALQEEILQTLRISS